MMKSLLVSLSVVMAAVAVSASSDVSAMVDPYLRIQTALAADSMKDVQADAGAVAAAAGRLGAEAAPIRTAASALQQASAIGEARTAFFALSEALIAWAEKTKTPMGGVKKAYCPMEKKHWVQSGDRIANPYAGKKMLRCGEFQGSY